MWVFLIVVVPLSVVLFIVGLSIPWKRGYSDDSDNDVFIDDGFNDDFGDQ